MSRPSNLPFSLRVLGPTELGGPDADGGDALVRQSKRLALLTYLAIASADGFRRRDQVVALFWAEIDQAQARTYLRKTLHGIRESLGIDPCLTRGEDELRVDSAVLWCDAVAIRAHAHAGDWELVLSLYRGDLLDGVYPEGVAPEFQQWLDAQRRELRELAARSAGEASLAAERLGDLGLAVVKARRARELDPNDERAVRRLIELLDRRGDRGAALRTYTDWQTWLFDEYGVEPDPETRKLAGRVRAVRRGESRETPPAQPAPPTSLTSVSERTPAAPVAVPSASSAPRTTARRTWRWGLALMVSVVGLLATMWALKPWTPAAGPASLALLPLRTIGAEAPQPTSDVVTEELVTTLIATPELVYRSATGVRPLFENGETLERVGRRLGVAFIIDGSIQSEMDRHRLTLQLFRSSDGIALWAGSFDFMGDSSVAIVAAAAATIARAIAREH